ncbi:hypothetical protein ACH5RR_000753 [Cinchona calisaya]|uniref:Uncharacterized protein n=1 Tax=Cinchona calisaya TaxID=153742 RepID=A0ABD3B2N0_9GENT
MHPPCAKGKSGKKPNVAKFIAALAIRNNTQLMVMVCANSARSIALALGATARETGGRAVYILLDLKELHTSRKVLGCHADFNELVVVNAQSLNEYHDANFVLIDCKLEKHKAVVVTGQRCLKKIILCRLQCYSW